MMPDGVTKDRAYGLRLVERAMDRGFSPAAFWYYNTLKTQDALERSARSGSAMSLRILAVSTAMSYCESGELPDGTMDALLEEYGSAINPDRDLRFLPEELRKNYAEEQPDAYLEIQDDIVNGIPGHFDELCTAPNGFEKMMPTD
jgi:hypothetical protein